jgi:hypothetical protein
MDWAIDGQVEGGRGAGGGRCVKVLIAMMVQQREGRTLWRLSRWIVEMWWTMGERRERE